MCKFFPVFTEDDLGLCADETMDSVKHFGEISHLRETRAGRDYLNFYQDQKKA
jgi:hypothetical protein